MAITVKALMADSPLDRLETRMVFEHVLNVSRTWLITHDSDVLADQAVKQIKALFAARQEGQPMAYLLAHREFMGLNFAVSPAVLIPRPDTETLVEKAQALIAEKNYQSVLDLGTGSGAIAVSLAYYQSLVQLTACDFSEPALAVAQKNAQQLLAPNALFRTVHSNWYEALKGQRFDLIVSNPPYIAANDEHLTQGDLRFEPQMALTDFADGLADIRQIISGAPEHLNQGGALWLEHGWDQAQAVRLLLQEQGFTQVCSVCDLAGIERISGGFYL